MDGGAVWASGDRRWSAALFATSIFLVIWIFSQDVYEAAKFFLFFVLFNCLPSLVLLDLLFPRWRDRPSALLLLVAFAPVGGLIFLLPWWAANLKLGYSLVPVAALLLFKTSRLQADMHGGALRQPPQLLLVAAILVATPIISLALTWSGPLTDHLLIQASIAAKLDTGYRPEFALVGGVPLAYNYAAHIWLAASSYLTGIPLEHLVAYAAPALLLYCAAAALASLGYYAGLSGRLVALVVCCVLWYAGSTLIGARLFARAFTWSSFVVIGPLLAYSAFMVLVIALSEWFSTPDEQRNSEMYIFAFLVALVLVGCRAPGGIVLLCALALVLLREVLVQKRLSFASLGMFAVVVVAVGLGLVFFLGYGSGFDSGSFTKINATPFAYLALYEFFWLPALLKTYGVNSELAGALQFAVITVFQAGFFTPFLIWRMSTLRRPYSPLEVLLFGTGVAGLAALFFLESGGGSHFTFLNYSTIAFSLLGAMAFSDLAGIRTRQFYAAIAVAGVLAIAQIAELPFRALSGIASRWAPPSSEVRRIAQRCTGEPNDATVPRVPAGASVVLPANVGLCQRLRFTIRNPDAHNYMVEWLRDFAAWETSLKPELNHKLAIVQEGPAALAAALPPPSYVMVTKGDGLAVERVEASH